tara:strand:+ start:54 stop:230 length:177 start_codon:yes stop_codon:yes gene_type:complete
MDKNIEYTMIKELTSKDNRWQLVKYIIGGATLTIAAYLLLYFFMFFILWADKITDKII